MNLSPSNLEISRVSQEHVQGLSTFFATLRKAGDEEWFHPHPLTQQQVRQLADHGGRDLYYVLWDGHFVLAYGMLRGWDEGFSVPSLGIAVHPSERGKGTGELLIHFLHYAARRRGSARIRLKVNRDNEAALRLFRSSGYALEDHGGEYLIGHLELR